MFTNILRKLTNTPEYFDIPRNKLNYAKLAIVAYPAAVFSWHLSLLKRSAELDIYPDTVYLPEIIVNAAFTNIYLALPALFIVIYTPIVVLIAVVCGAWNLAKVTALKPTLYLISYGLLPTDASLWILRKVKRAVEDGNFLETEYGERCIISNNIPKNESIENDIRLWWAVRKEDIFNKEHPINIIYEENYHWEENDIYLENKRKLIALKDATEETMGLHFAKAIRNKIVEGAKAAEARKPMSLDEAIDRYMEANGIPKKQEFPIYYSESLGRYHHGELTVINNQIHRIMDPIPAKVRTAMALRKKELFQLENGKTITVGSLSDDFVGILKGSVFDYVVPASAEFRSIVELYSFVVSLLLAIFALLVCALVYAVVKAVKNIYESAARLSGPVPLKFKSSFGFEYTSRWVKRRYYKDESWNKLADKNPALKPAIQKITKLVHRYRETDFNKFRASSVAEMFYVYYSKVEFSWTSWPVYVLLFISLPSFTLALALDESHKPQNWLKVVGNQWYWIYEYSNFSEVEDDYSVGVIYSNIVQGEDLKDESLRLLEPDTLITVPANQFTRLLVTSNDVIHSWAVPSMGIKVDACPGRINALTILPTRAGVYYGQCSEICGVNHAFMPICLEVTA